MPPDPDRRHVLHLSDRHIAAIERSLRTRHRILELTGEMRSTEQISVEADLLATVAGIVQQHRGPGCDCMQPIVPDPQPATIPFQQRRS